MKITFLMLIATIIAITLSAQTVTRNVTTAGLTSGRVPYTTSGGAITDAATLTYNGTSLMSTRSGNDYELLQVQNTGNGASAMAGLFFYNDNGQIGSIRAHGSGTGAGIGFANAVNLYGTTTAGINLIASNASGPVNIYAGGTSAGDRRVQVSSSGMTVGGGTALAYAAHGTGTFTAGTVTISNTNVTANSRILVTRTSSGTGVPYVSAKTASTSFTVTSSDGADTGTFDYWIVN